MDSHSFTEENYLKAIYQLSRKSKGDVSTNAIAQKLDTKASSVTDMLKKLAAKKLINYQKYQGVSLTKKGTATAVLIIRKHRLWEVFLVEKLQFKWDEVHEIAEELEHIGSEKLINQLDKYLEYPKFDPHGDPIPDKDGNVFFHKDLTLADLEPGESGIVVGVKDSSKNFLQYLENTDLILGRELNVVDHFDYDDSLAIQIDSNKKVTVSHQVARNLYVRKNLK